MKKKKPLKFQELRSKNKSLYLSYKTANVDYSVATAKRKKLNFHAHMRLRGRGKVEMLLF